ncbi:MAG: glyoxalase/bleomycin resistance/extradiol dioxygenase family protein [Anaerosolibacter sp.]|jgi:predicted lactoylglutathione lyase|uniref:VOC family protein n=1 Tax=Anaerosolibacter sp. TaxID=1872527 RepID=UPI0026216361|nr:VOC family protein [Anaerosolibacter sp.]MDF2547690.1 glyoxalase/bleomycin resistance/extradiol dioxygenase family protein [Anaerosolibacter sp.]
MVQAIYINLPVANLNKTREFWSKLGFSFNEQFSDDKALCLELSPPSIYAMLITKDYFETFTDRPVADGKTTQVLLSIQVESRKRVDELVAMAVHTGANRYRDATDHGWMYYDSFVDVDGHQWEVMFADEAQIPLE